jgi:hypothetical protein
MRFAQIVGVDDDELRARGISEAFRHSLREQCG